MSMDSIVYYRDAEDRAHGAYVNEGMSSKNIAPSLRDQFGQSRGALVEWIDKYHRVDDDYHDGDCTWSEQAIIDSGADQFLFVDDAGAIQDVTARVRKSGLI